MAPDVGLAKGTRMLWAEELLLDYTIEVGDEQFRVHKVTMASVSDYFKAMLTGSLAESKSDRVRLEGLSSLVVANMIDFIYTGEFGSPRAGTEELLGAAVYLQIQSAIKACTDLLYDKVNVNNCLQILSTFKTYSVVDGIKRTTRYIQANMDELLDTFKPEEMSREELVNLMDSWGKSEWELVNMAIKWLHVDFKKRKEHINELMSHVRFKLLPVPKLLTLMDTVLFSSSDGPWHDHVEEALWYHKFPMHQQVLDDSEQTQIRTEPAPVLFATIDKWHVEDMYRLDQGTSWESCDSSSVPQIDCPPGGLLEINNFLIVCDPLAKDWHIFDPRTFSWSEMAPRDYEKHWFGLVYHERQLYVLGGMQYEDDYSEVEDWTDVIETYDFKTNSWSVIESKMVKQLHDPDAFSIGGYIYVALGWIKGEFPSTAVDCLDLNKGTWSRKAPLPTVTRLHSKTQLVEIGGEEVIAGFDRYFILHYYKPSTDQWSVYNPSQSTGLELTADNQLLARGNCIFLLDLASIRVKAGHTPTRTIAGKQLSGGACEKWTLGEEGPMIDKSLERLPIDTDSRPPLPFEVYFSVLLSLSCPSPSKGPISQTYSS